MSSFRRQPFLNPSAKTWVAPPSEPTDIVEAFHRKLPGYAPTRLVPLPFLAKDLGVKAVYIKEESNRMGVPSFKILGASWGTFRAVTQALHLPLDSNLSAIRAASQTHPLTLVAATAGNHGRAVARIGSILALPVTIYIPQTTHPSTHDLIAAEGASIIVVPGDYDAAMRAAFAASHTPDHILIQDTAFPGYEDVPSWIVQGYTTLLRETTSQLDDAHHSTHVVAPVGVGSFAHAVVAHYKARSPSPVVVAVEPDTAACLHASLVAGSPTTVQTGGTVMAGLNCGTLSSTAWPALKHGVDVAVSVADGEAHAGVVELREAGVDAGPCAGAGVAAVRAQRRALGLGEGDVVVLLGTEGGRAYEVPRGVGGDDVRAVAQELVRIDSVNPGCGGGGEKGVVEWIRAWLEHRGVETHVVEEVEGRPSVVGVVRGTGGGKSLMLNGHVDTVTLEGYDGDALSGEIEGGKLYGRGAADMKGGVAAAMCALVRVKDVGLRGDVIFTGVADEEDLSIGTEQVLRAGWTADAAVVTEPSNEGIVVAHKGFVWLEVDVLGVASHGSRPDLGVDAISKAGYFLVELDKHAKGLQEGPKHPQLGPGSIHASMVKGGEEASSYPAKCTITLERRTVPGETAATVREEVEHILRKVAGEVPSFQYDLRVTFSRSTFEIKQDHPFVSLVSQHAERTTGSKPDLLAEPFWTDCALLSDKRIPVVIYGPKGEGFHAKTEWVDLNSVESVTETLTNLALEFCK